MERRRFPTEFSPEPLSVCRWLALPPEELLKACKQARFQGSGPGGQKRNRVYSGIRLTHEASGLYVESDASRESRRNLEDALHRLRIELALSVLSEKGGKAKQPVTTENQDQAWVIESTAAFQHPDFRTQASPSHVDFPILALRAIYFLNKYDGQIAAAAKSLNCTASALTRFLKLDKTVWTAARRIREAHGLHPLK